MIEQSTLLILTASIGAMGALVGSVVGAVLQHRFALRQREIELAQADEANQKALREKEEREATMLRSLISDLDVNVSMMYDRIVNRSKDDYYALDGRRDFGRGERAFHDLGSASLPELRHLYSFALSETSVFERANLMSENLANRVEKLEKEKNDLIYSPEYQEFLREQQIKRTGA